MQYTFFENLTMAMLFICLILMGAAAAKYLLQPVKKPNEWIDKYLKAMQPFIDRIFPKRPTYQPDEAEIVVHALKGFVEYKNLNGETVDLVAVNAYLWEREIPFVIIVTSNGLEIKER